MVIVGLATKSGVGVRVGARLARGGQGEVFEVGGRSDAVFKRYHREELGKDPELADRLTLMVTNRPAGCREDRSGHVLLPWPAEVVLEGGRFVGYLMPRVDASASARLLRVTDPSDRRRAQGDASWLRGFNWRYLVTTAANLALAVEALHADDVVIGDFNDANVAVTRRAQVTFFDCDSMQITDPRSGRRFLCRVYRPEFLAPELVGVDLKVTFRPKSSDLFSLAVHIHQLLLEGEHPFRGKWAGSGEPPAEAELARQGLWTHAGDGRISPRRAAIGIDLLPPQITSLFRKAFVDGANAPGLRPDAATWHKELHNLSAHLTVCTLNNQHWYPASSDRCPWCIHDKTRSTRSQPTTQTALPVIITALPPVALTPSRLVSPGGSLPIGSSASSAGKVRAPTTTALPMGTVPARRVGKAWIGYLMLLLLNLAGPFGAMALLLAHGQPHGALLLVPPLCFFWLFIGAPWALYRIFR